MKPVLLIFAGASFNTILGLNNLKEILQAGSSSGISSAGFGQLFETLGGSEQFLKNIVALVAGDTQPPPPRIGLRTVPLAEFRPEPETAYFYFANAEQYVEEGMQVWEKLRQARVPYTFMGWGGVQG